MYDIFSLVNDLNNFDVFNSVFGRPNRALIGNNDFLIKDENNGEWKDCNDHYEYVIEGGNNYKEGEIDYSKKDALHYTLKSRIEDKNGYSETFVEKTISYPDDINHDTLSIESDKKGNLVIRGDKKKKIEEKPKDKVYRIGKK